MSTSDPRPGSGPGRLPPPRGSRAVVEAVLSVVKVYSFAGWAYIALNAVFHPQTLSLRLTHFAPWPREDTFGVACFIVSVSSALALALLRARR